MGERAIAVIPRGETSLLFQSQWGAREEVLERVFRSPRPLDVLLCEEWAFLSECSPTGASELIDMQTTDALYVLTHKGVQAFCPLWFGLGISEQPRPYLGLLAPVNSLEAVRRCRGSLRQFKGLLLDIVRTGLLSRTVANEVLTRACILLKSIQRSISPCSEYL